MFNFLRKTLVGSVNTSLFDSSTVPGTQSQSGYCLLTGRDAGMISQSFALEGSTHSKTNSISYLEVREEVYRAAESTHSQCRVLRALLPPLEVGVVTISPTPVLPCRPAWPWMTPSRSVSCHLWYSCWVGSQKSLTWPVHQARRSLYPMVHKYLKGTCFWANRSHLRYLRDETTMQK